MRTAAVVLLLSVAGCSVPRYSLRSSSSTLLASNEPLPLVPPVHHGHSATWKAGAAVTVGSLAVALLGAGLTIGGLQGIHIDGPRSHNNEDMLLAGVVISAVGDGGLFLGGPITWIAGMGGARD